MTRVAFMFVKRITKTDVDRPYGYDETDMRTYIVRDDTKFKQLVRCVEIKSREGRTLLEDVAVKLGVIELEHHIDSISAVWETKKVFVVGKIE